MERSHYLQISESVWMILSTIELSGRVHSLINQALILFFIVLATCSIVWIHLTWIWIAACSSFWLILQSNANRLNIEQGIALSIRFPQTVINQWTVSACYADNENLIRPEVISKNLCYWWSVLFPLVSVVTQHWSNAAPWLCKSINQCLGMLLEWSLSSVQLTPVFKRPGVQIRPPVHIQLHAFRVLVPIIDAIRHLYLAKFERTATGTLYMAAHSIVQSASIVVMLPTFIWSASIRLSPIPFFNNGHVWSVHVMVHVIPKWYMLCWDSLGHINHELVQSNQSQSSFFFLQGTSILLCNILLLITQLSAPICAWYVLCF